jgi:hypothetical protein
VNLCFNRLAGLTNEQLFMCLSGLCIMSAGKDFLCMKVIRHDPKI